MSRDRDAIPVTILSGSLGAGKTTLLNHLLAGAGDRDIAVLVNDMGDINVDADLVSGNTDLAVDGGVAELSNGCICCELRDDLETAVVRLARERGFDHLVVEASGISEPRPVARLFTTGSQAAARYDVASVVSVVDARQFHDAFGDEGVAARRGTGDDDTRPLSDLLVEGVEFANLVVLNKTDLVTPDELDAVEEMVRALRPDAEVVRTEHSRVDPGVVLERRYDPATADEAGWKRALEGDDHDDDHAHDHADHAHDHADHAHDHDAHAHPEAVYGVTSFTYRRRRPFHPARLRSLLADLPPAVVRSKGTCWIATGADCSYTMGQAGPSVRVEVAGPWIASLPEFEQDAYRRNRSNLEWDEEWGDRRTELVFIGRGMDDDALIAALDDCLLTDDEMAADWDGFGNAFPTEAGEELVVTEP
ncbi:CobW family GTP-binding protein [Haloplanus rubicundus]|uniref:GTP-binding protein n=1 Tax=Haloplanus rubicundus TaxID=1547898 RepID=A0A345E9D5_9EURY|nr:GTP-binding protein [Haloplanus rubicundus]AXG08807.1 GTP-binding protein [Haloplanus rubicundus]